MKKTAHRRLIQSVDRALKILDVLANRDEPIGLTELARKMGLDSSTVYRLLYTLRVHGYAQQDSGDKRYRLGPKAIELGQKALDRFSLRRQAGAFVRELAAKTGESALLATLVGGKPICVENEDGAGLFRMSPQVGSEAFPHCTATGKAIAANLPERELQQLLAKTGVWQFTDKTITDLGALRIHLRKVREEGYAVNDEEIYAGLRGLAAPVFDHRGLVVGSIGISGPVSRMTPEKLEESKQVVMNLARELSRSIGYVETAE